MCQSVLMSGDVYHPASDDSIRQRPAGADKGASGWPTWRSLRLAQYQAWYLADFDSQDGTIFDGRVLRINQTFISPLIGAGGWPDGLWVPLNSPLPSLPPG